MRLFFSVSSRTLSVPLRRQKSVASERHMHSSHAVPLVLLPGTGCNHLLWKSCLPLLSKSIKPIAVDLLSCQSKDEMLRRVYQQPYEKFALCGFSMGGTIAQEFYATFPERVSELILVCSSGEGYSSAAQIKIKKIIDDIAAGKILLTGQDYLAKFVKQEEHYSEDIYKTLRTMLISAGTEQVCKQMMNTLDRKNYTHIFQKLPLVPSLIIGARYDKIVTPSAIEALAKTLNTKPVWVDAGHMAPLEVPQDISTILNHWFALRQSPRSRMSV